MECIKVWSIWFPVENKAISKFRKYYTDLENQGISFHFEIKFFAIKNSNTIIPEENNSNSDSLNKSGIIQSDDEIRH